MAVSNQLVNGEGKKIIPFSQAIQGEGIQTLINSVLKDKDRVNRFVTAVVAAVSQNAQLQKCSAKTIISVAMQGEALNLSPSPALGEYAIVPYGVKWNNKLQDYEEYKAQFQIMTNGRVQLAMRTGQYEDLDVIEIREGEYKGKDKKTGKPTIEFIEDDDLRETKPIIGYYAYFKLLNGFFKCAYLPKAKVIEHAKRYSKSFDIKIYEKVQRGEEFTDWKEKGKAETPWIQHFDTMAKNLALRTVLKNAPKSIEMRTAENYEEKSENEANLAGVIATQEQTESDFFGDEVETTDTIDTETGEVKTKRVRNRADEEQQDLFGGE